MEPKASISHPLPEDSTIEYRDLLDNARDLIFIVGADCRLLYFNQTFQSDLRFSQDELLGKDVFTIIEPSCIEKCQESLEKVLLGNQSETIQTTFLTKEGHKVSVEGSCTLGHFQGDANALCGIFHNISQQKRERELLEASEEMYRSLIEQAPDAIFISDENLRFTELNSRAVEVTGFSRDEILNMSVYDFIPPEIIAAEPLRLDELKSGRTVVTERMFMRKDGRLIPVEVSSKMLSSGKVQAIVRDISQRKQAELALRASELRMRELLENMALIAVMLDTQGRIVFCNDFLLQLTGRDRDEVIGRDWFSNFVPGDSHDEKAKFIDSVSRKLLPTDLNPKIVSRSGEIREIKWNNTLLRDFMGEVIGTARIGEDVTEQRLAEAALRESEANYRTLVESASDSIMVVDVGARVLDVNAAACSLWGYSREEFLAMTIADLVAHSEVERIPSELGRLKAEEVVRTEWLCRRKDDILFTVEVAATKLPDGRIIGIIRDITERNKADAELRASSEQLRALSARLRSAREQEGARIAREIHDELGGALTGLKWDLEAIDKALARNEKISSIRKKIPALTGVINETIDTVRRISAELRPSILDDLGLIAAIEWQAQQFQQRTGIECYCKTNSENVELSIDRATALFRIFQEILTNVLRHANAKRVDIEMVEAGDEFILKVMDDGRGITSAEMQNTKSLGLLGMKERAFLVGGTIQHKGAKRKGTSVTVRVPLN